MPIRHSKRSTAIQGTDATRVRPDDWNADHLFDGTTLSLTGMGIFNIKDSAYGAVGDGVTDDTAAVQAAITAADAIGGGVVYFPQGQYLLSGSGAQLLLVKSPLILQGCGLASKLVIKSTVGGTVDVLRVAPAAGGGDFLLGQGSFFSLRDLVVVAQSGTPARDAVKIDLSAVGTTVYARRWSIARCWLGALGGRAIVLSNGTFAAPTHTDGFFTSSIVDCQIYNGIQLTAGGDSIIIERNVLTGANAAVESAQISGAAQLLVRGNNITSAGGALWAKSGFGIIFRDNEVEQNAAYAGGSGNALVDIDGSSETCIAPLIEGNTISWIGVTANPTDLIRVNAATDAVVRHNALRPPVGKQAVRVTASSTGALIGRNSYDLSLGGGAVADAGVTSTNITERADQAVGFSTPLTINAASGENVFVGPLTNNISISPPLNSLRGRCLNFFLVQDGVGGRTVTWDAIFLKTWSDVGNVAGTRSSISFYCDGSNWYQVGAQRLWA